MIPEKVALRNTYRVIRRSLTAERRSLAARELVHTLVPKLQSFRTILSFSSTGSEIDLGPLNNLLAEEKRLLLPRLENMEIIPYCGAVSVDPATIACILVPGLVFDSHHRRIGYGLGYYDRFLIKTRGHTIGLGFREQLSPTPLPCEPHDYTLAEVLLF